MAKLLCYTSPARGHLFPTVPILLELRRRGHEVAVRTLAAEVARVSVSGIRASPLAPEIERVEHDDYGAASPPAALDRAVRVFVARAEHEIPDLERALAEERPDQLLVDFNCWGAQAVAEKSGLPWALFMPYFLPWKLEGVPPFGPGLAPRSGVVGRVRDAVVGKLVHGLMNRNLPKLNAVRARVGLGPIAHMTEQGRSAPKVLYYTAEPFEYPCATRPSSVLPIGPGLWEPDAGTPTWLAGIDRPLVLVTCSTEFQDDGRLVEVALEAFAQEDVFVVATTAAVDPSRFRAPANARVERFVPHAALLARAAAVVCHGGMGITQKALAAGVPVCVVPFGRDQNEVAAHVVASGAGTSLAPKRLTPERLRAALALAREKKAGAQRVAEGFRAAGGAPAAADALESMLAARSSAAA